MKNLENEVKHKKIKIKNKKKFITTIIVLLVVILLLIVVLSGKNQVIDNNTNILEVNAKKYSDEIKSYYESEGMKETFVSEHTNLQNQIWTYIYNNINQDNTIEVLMDEVNKILLSDDWSSLNLEKYKKWNGTYHIDSHTNILYFKFKNKKIEPKWIEDEDINYIFEKN